MHGKAVELVISVLKSLCRRNEKDIHIIGMISRRDLSLLLIVVRSR